MSGFTSIIGFMFSFFVIVLVFFGSFYSYNSQILKQDELIRSFEEESFNNLNYDYALKNPYFSSGRLSLYLDNLGKEMLDFRKNENICFDFFINSNYISKNNLFFSTLNGLKYDYSSINYDNYGIVDIKEDLNLSDDLNIKSLSCGGIEKEYIFNSENHNWWDYSWLLRKFINVENVALEQIVDYQVLVELNSSIFDFSKFNENEIRFVLPLHESYVLDLTFDDYEQIINDYSKYSNIVYLGLGSGIEVFDPIEDIGIVFDGLFFDGIDDYLTIIPDSSLELDKSLTYSLWAKWNQSGNSIEYLYVNGNSSNSLAIINDGGVNDKLIQFSLNIEGSTNVLYSNVTIDNDWHHIVATFDGGVMKLYIDSILVGENLVVGEILTYSSNNYIGSLNGGASFYKGNLDEIKILNFALSLDEVKDLYHNNLRFKELDFYIFEWDIVSENAKIYVKIPGINPLGNITFEMYYNNKEDIGLLSNITSTFSYDSPRKVGYVVSELISGTIGATILSLYDNNTIYLGDDVFNYNSMQGGTLAATNINSFDEIKLKSLAQIEGNGDGGDIIVPISWAGTEFYYRGFRPNPDRFCMLSPFGIANVEVNDAGTIVWTGNVGPLGTCVNSLNIGTNNVAGIISDIPILVSFYGSTSNDAFVFYPATSEDLYGVPSNTLLVGSGPSGANVDVFSSLGATNNYNLVSYESISNGGLGAKGTAPAHRIQSDNIIGAIQQADSDGTESSVFVPKKEMGLIFGSNLDATYIAIASMHSDANCSVYNSLGNLVGNTQFGVGSNGVYKYEFGVGNSNLYVAAPWRLECSKSVWPYYENIGDLDEVNLLGHLQMKQYIYPEPIIIIN